MRVNLPTDMAAKLATVRRRHRRVAGSVAAVAIPAALAFVWLGPPGRPAMIAFALFYALFALAYFRWLWCYDAALCRELGLVCPHCARPLYLLGDEGVTRSGLCPRCRQRVVMPWGT